jgi:hypothetical protein
LKAVAALAANLGIVNRRSAALPPHLKKCCKQFTRVFLITLSIIHKTTNIDLQEFGINS